MEDAANMLLKELGGKALSINEMREIFQNKCSAVLDSAILKEALSSLEERNLTRQTPDGMWEKL